MAGEGCFSVRHTARGATRTSRSDVASRLRRANVRDARRNRRCRGTRVCRTVHPPREAGEQRRSECWRLCSARPASERRLPIRPRPFAEPSSDQIETLPVASRRGPLIPAGLGPYLLFLVVKNTRAEGCMKKNACAALARRPPTTVRSPRGRRRAL